MAVPQASETGVVYLSRIPHGFYEDQMRAYFSQFGEISRLRLSRNKRVRLLGH
jgi:nucleolar protein 15